MSNESEEKTSPESIFISYSHRDADAADFLAKICKRRGARIWIDDTKIKPGEFWQDKLETAVRSCDTFLVLVSDAALSSDRCSREWSAICERNWTNPRVRVIPILVDEAKVPAFLRNLRALDGRDRRRLQNCVKEIADYPAADPSAFKFDSLSKEAREDLTDRVRALLDALHDQESSSLDTSPKKGRS
jgi:hypothetical protein